MAITWEKSTTLGSSGSNGTTIACSFATLPSVGGTVFVVAWLWNGTQTPTNTYSCADNQGNTYTKLKESSNNSSGNQITCTIFAAHVGTSSGTFTVTVTASGTVGVRCVCAASFLNVANPPTVDGSATNSNSTGTGSSGTTGTLTSTDEVAIAACVMNGTPTNWNSGQSFSNIANTTNGSTLEAGTGDYKILTATTGVQDTWPNASTGLWAAAIATVAGVASSITAGEMMAARQFGQLGPVLERKQIVDY